MIHTSNFSAAVAIVCATFLFGTAGLAGGCSGPSAWDKTFVPDSALPTVKLDRNAPVILRQVPFDPLSQAMTEIDEEVSRTGAPMNEWPPEKKAAAKARLLKALEYTGDPNAVEVLGHCDFRSTAKIDPDSGKDAIEPFARLIGATQAVWARHFLGRAERIVDKPMAGVPGESMWGRSYETDPYGSPLPVGATTTYVPVKVVEDENQFIAYFLRDLVGGVAAP